MPKERKLKRYRGYLTVEIRVRSEVQATSQAEARALMHQDVKRRFTGTISSSGGKCVENIRDPRAEINGTIEEIA